MPKNALAFKKPSLLNKSSVLQFKEHQGETVAEVMKYDAQYLIWLAEKEIVQFESWLLDDIYELEQEQDPMGDYWAYQDPLHPFEDDIFTWEEPPY